MQTKPKILAKNKNGFKITWLTEKENDKDHKWWHFIFLTARQKNYSSFIKNKKYQKRKLWVFKCMKCKFKKLEVREVWLPGEDPVYSESDKNFFQSLMK